jgi:predicted dehydrogenase
MSTFPITRRTFTAGVAAVFVNARSLRAAAVAASERITVGVVGLGSRGFNLLDEFLAHPAAQVVAICDVDRFHHRDRPWGTGIAFGQGPGQQRVEKAYANPKSGTTSQGLLVTSDFREICGRDDIDVVVVATPDHWHAHITLAALNSGKDVYCEKPVTHLFHEGLQVSRAVEKNQAVFQTGSQQRSDALFRRAVQIVRNGLIGDVQQIEVGLPPGYDKPQGATDVSEPPDHLDYDFWCGPSEKLPYMRARHHRWWRGHRAYGGGVLMDWIGHHNDIAHWAIDAERTGPETVEAVDWTFPDTDVYNTPHQYTIRCTYSGGIESTISSRNRQGLKVIGSEGWVFVTRGRIEASDKRWLAPDFSPGSVNVYESDSHVGNFLDCVRSRQECIAPADIAHRSITPGHLGYVSQALQRPLAWNSVAQTVQNDDEANRRLLQASYRAPWNLS